MQAFLVLTRNMGVAYKNFIIYVRCRGDRQRGALVSGSAGAPERWRNLKFFSNSNKILFAWKNIVKSSNIMNCLQDTVPVLSKSNVKNSQKLGWFCIDASEIFQKFYYHRQNRLNYHSMAQPKILQGENQVVRLGQLSSSCFQRKFSFILS